MAKKALYKRRPAETGTALAGAVVVLLNAMFGPWEPEVITALVIVISALPSGITALVERFGSGRQVVDAIE